MRSFILALSLASLISASSGSAAQQKNTDHPQDPAATTGAPAAPAGSAAPAAPANSGVTDGAGDTSEVAKLKATAKDVQEVQDLLVHLTGSNETICSMNLEACTPPRILVNGDTKSNVRIVGIPADTCRVVATANETFRKQVLNSDEYRVDDLAPKVLLLNLHLRKLFFTTYGALSNGTDDRNAIVRLRPTDPPPQGLNLLVHSSVKSVKIEAYPCTPDKSAQPKTAVVDIDYGRWDIEGGGFYAFSSLADEELVKQPVTVGSIQQVKVLKRAGGYRGDTGVSFNFYPGNYPWMGFAFGIANAGQAPSYFLGLGPRLLSFGKRAVVAATVGLAAVKLKTFPGIKDGDILAADSPLLDGQTSYHVKPYVSIHLGFSVGAQTNGGAKPAQ